MRYLIFILIAVIVVTLLASLYGWYYHLRDDEDYLYYSPEYPVDSNHARTSCIQPAARLRQRDHASTPKPSPSASGDLSALDPPLMH
jgi:hypothetical protein